MSKYNNKKVIKDGITFDSIKEYQYYLYLKSEEKSGNVMSFDIHKRIELIPSFKSSSGEKIRAVHYSPDFIVYRNGTTEFIDVKGVKTKEFIIKWKMLQYRYRDDTNYKFTIV